MVSCSYLHNVLYYLQDSTFFHILHLFSLNQITIYYYSSFLKLYFYLTHELLENVKIDITIYLKRNINKYSEIMTETLLEFLNQI